MDTIVYNLASLGMDLSVESLSIRLGLLMSQRVFSTGSAYNFIYYEKMLFHSSNTLEFKLRILEKQPGYLRPDQEPNEMYRFMKSLWKLRRKTECLKQYKQMEHSVDVLYKSHMNERVQAMKKYGMSQFADLQDGDVLLINNGDNPKGEAYMSGFQISELLQLKQADTRMVGPYAFILYDKLALLPQENEAGQTHLFRIPNLNCLSNEQLLALRESMRSVMARFQKLLQPLPQEDPVPCYRGGHWQKEQLTEVGMSIQRAIDTNDDLNWVLSFQPDIAIDVLVGEMDTHRFWQHMRDHGLIPDDSWEVLQGLPKDGSYPPTIPIIALRHNSRVEFNERTFSEESSLQHKRKTLSLD